MSHDGLSRQVKCPLCKAGLLLIGEWRSVQACTSARQGRGQRRRTSRHGMRQMGSFSRLGIQRWHMHFSLSEDTAALLPCSVKQLGGGRAGNEVPVLCGGAASDRRCGMQRVSGVGLGVLA